MNGILKYTRRLSSVIWKLLKYMRRLALTVCVLFTTVFWVVWAIALSQGLIYCFQYWKLGLRMTIVTLAAFAATVLWRFLDARHVGVLTAFLTFEVTLMFLWPMVDLYYEGFNWDLISYQIKWIDGNTYIKVDDYPEPERYYEIKGEGRFFWRILNGDIVNNKYALEKKYYKGFSEVMCEDGITRYIPNGYPEVKVRVYDNRDWKKGDVVDDYLQKMERYLILQCYKEEGMTWEYVYISSNSFGEGDLYFVVKEDDDLVQYSKDISKMIDAVLSEYPRSLDEGITVKYVNKSTTDTGRIFKFGDSYPEQPEYYTDWRHVFEVLEDGM